MANIIIGRQEEKDILNELLADENARLLAVYGRRRIGKTYLIKTFFKDHLVFDCSGEAKGIMAAQLKNFTVRLTECFGKKSIAVPATWQQAFQLLESLLQKSKSRKKKVIFFDELPWLDTHKSGFLSAFTYWWNMYAAADSSRLVVICGSAASWMIKKVVNNKGGLHNRITRRLRLAPFTLKETEDYLLHRKVNLTRYQILQLYMIMGGVPHYLNTILPGKSVAQCVQKACFTKDGLLTNEFENLYNALFNYADKHIMVVRLLASKGMGLTRGEIVAGIKKITSGGTLSLVLDELLESGFIDKVLPFQKKSKDTVYRLTDEFSGFYFRFMASAGTGNGWAQVQQSSAFQIWCGFAFENICMRHIEAIKKALGISSVYTEQCAWRLHGNKTKKGAQIDLLIDRKDGCINLCEMKFYNTEFTVTKKYAGELADKRTAFVNDSKTGKAVFVTLITTYAVVNNPYKLQQIQDTVTMNGLFL
jgi:uncharacterized protein